MSTLQKETSIQTCMNYSQHCVCWWPSNVFAYRLWYYNDVIMSAMAQITGVSIVYSTVCVGADQRNHQSSASLTFVRGIHRWPLNSPHKGPVTRKVFPFDDVIMSKRRLWGIIDSGGRSPLGLTYRGQPYTSVSNAMLTQIHWLIYTVFRLNEINKATRYYGPSIYRGTL